MEPNGMFFQLAASLYKENDWVSKFLYHHHHQGDSKMPGTGDAGDHNTETQTCLESSIRKSKVDLLSAPTGSIYPELEDMYKLHKTIGNGGFSKVKMATELATGEKVAIKIVDKDHVGAELPRINIEIETLQPLCHKHVCKLMKVFHSEKKIFMIMEYCPTDLYEYIILQNDYLSEDEARRIFIQLLSAVAYLHTNGIVHRDLKPENILLDYDNRVKLTDFGLCAVPMKKGINKPILRTMCGSPAYCAPELLRGPPYIGSKVDVWSLGVILFVLLSGQLPFYSKNLRDLYKKIQEVQYLTPDWFSPGATDLIDKMLQLSPTIRPSLNMMWSHPWIQQGDLESFQDQIKLAEEEVAEEMLQSELNASRSRSIPMNIVGYMDTNSSSRASIPIKNLLPVLIQESKEIIQEDPKLLKPTRHFGWISRGFRWVRKGIRKVQRSLTKKDDEIDQEPKEIDAVTLCSDKTISGLNVIDEEFADCILDKLQIALQSIGISSKRKGGSVVKNGVASPCKFRFEVISLEPWNLFCLQRKYISSKDPQIIRNIMQTVLLISNGPPP